MISEIQFSTSHSDFWHALLPMSESFIRAQNAEPRTFTKPMPALSPASVRGEVNEAAFLVFEEVVRTGQTARALPSERITALIEIASEYVSGLRAAKGGGEERKTSSVNTVEVLLLADRIVQFFNARAPEYSGCLALNLRPKFAGCGWLDAAEADVFQDKALYEVKAGERQFRGVDLRQVLCYCALNFSSKQYLIEEVGILNPRSGTFIRENVESLCQKIAGLSSAAVLGEIINYISEPFSRYAPT